MSNKVTIIGAGSVGSTIAYNMVVTGIASEIVLIDINAKKAEGEAMDILQGVPFCSPVSIYAGTYADAKGSDIVILTSGMPRKAGQSRLELAQVNVDITKTIIPEIVKYAPEAVYIVVSNPRYPHLRIPQVLGSPLQPDHRFRHNPRYRSSAFPSFRDLQYQPAERSRLRIR